MDLSEIFIQKFESFYQKNPSALMKYMNDKKTIKTSRLSLISYLFHKQPQLCEKYYKKEYDLKKIEEKEYKMGNYGPIISQMGN